MKLLWIKWFPTDWLADGELSKTSLLGRGLWIEALNAMFNSDTYALSGTPDELSRLLRCDVAEFNTAFGDLQRHNAANVEVRNGVVTLISRRLERLQKRRENGRFRVSEHRKRKVCNTKSASVSASDQKGVADRRRGEFKKPTFPEMELHASKIGLPPIEINKFFDYYESNGWRVGKNPMKSWLGAMNNWKRNYDARRYEAGGGRAGSGTRENPRNVGIVKGSTNYAEAARRKAVTSQKTPVVGSSNQPESLPPATTGA